jgi:hypothetical protein
MRPWLFVLVVGCFVTASGGGVELACAGDEPAGAETIALEVYMGALRTLDVTVGEETIPFIFDTAGGLTFVTPQLAKRHGCRPYGRVVGFRMSGEQLASPRCGPMTFGIGGRQIVAETEILDIMALLPEGWPEIGGIISLHTFRDSAITIKLGANRVVVETEETLARRTATMHSLNTRANTQGGGESLDLFVEAAAERGSLWLEIDSGNLGPVVLAAHAFDQLGVTPPEAHGTQQIESELTLIGLDPIPVVVAEKEIIYDGAVNAQLLEAMVLTADLRTGRSWAQPVEKGPKEKETN